MPPAQYAHGAAIAFLHSSALHIGTFNALGAALAPGLKLAHTVREDLLVAAEKAGGVTPSIELKAGEAMLALAEGGARVVVCTCSTLGPVAERVADDADIPVMRIDRPMADEAVRSGARIGVCGALAPAMETTLRLLEDSAGKAGRSCRFTPVHFEDAWDRFKAGRLGAYHERIAEGLARAAADHDVLVLAQASMAPAAQQAGDLGIPVLSSPQSGFTAAVRIANRFK
ncbi:hypothetical protein FHS78_001330 [Parvibaculum indicum]|uniref:aspartate/glutamate racemase family protein n=1 Tax=Parvibaculum indicum TaxID=562969 RepID=UPI00141FEBAC|nr:aspartate/glutamate racemase family protein [Parvibaculum indicum]NIJ41049.1 hypothetical protein [Parvibaculum indicum]